MRVEPLTLPDGRVIDNYIAEEGEHLVVTGPVNGVVQLPDGTQVNVTPHVVALASPEQVEDLSHVIAMTHVENGHPLDVDTLTDPDTGADVVVQRPFVYEAPDGETHVGVGTPVGEHPLDYQLAEHDDEIAAAGDEAYRALKAEQSSPAAATTDKES